MDAYLMKSRLKSAWLVLAALLSAIPGWSAQTDLQAAVAGLQRRYAAVASIRCDFVQTYRAPGVDQTESGVLYMKKPGLMRWEYRSPEVKLFIADGRDTWLYMPEDRQVFVQRFTTEDLRSTPLQFLLGQGDLGRSSDVSWEGSGDSEGNLFLRLTPRAAEPDYGWLDLACDRATFDLRRIEIHERTGNVSEFVFRNMQVNGKTDGGLFQFKVPKGVEIVRLDNK
jgi:outer membrane lipoprotein carrier protein